ncbi:hypothetical protein [Halalkalibacterium halodurans]|uniref:hypothetical protein n=1 Tax=Halalkalibacterium halodurans TaxID=86665 RepID=UPI002AA98C43|nr:hypothetical protein [Halalkalibacterium halodurans]MDY7224679.1 hypothetical protein [Halalkalibacterium halodurans]MDY7243271.1 hypothetical protein [Halalkalibacterium halodurans]
MSQFNEKHIDFNPHTHEECEEDLHELLHGKEGGTNGKTKNATHLKVALKEIIEGLKLHVSKVEDNRVKQALLEDISQLEWFSKNFN